MRSSEIKRKTAETDISVKLDIDGSGSSVIETGMGFMDHMLTLFAAHGCFDLELKCRGDLNVDFHHSVEDIGIALGKAFCEAAGDKRGVRRYGDVTLPMDEALIGCALDLSGRAYPVYGLEIPAQKVGDFDTELTREFFVAFATNFPMALHLRQLAGINSHHIIEGAFKAFARALSQALEPDPRRAGRIPSTKGVI